MTRITVSMIMHLNVLSCTRVFTKGLAFNANCTIMNRVLLV